MNKLNYRHIVPARGWFLFTSLLVLEPGGRHKGGIA